MAVSQGGGRDRRRGHPSRSIAPATLLRGCETFSDLILRSRESGFQLYNSLGIPRGDKMGYAKQALENFNFFGAPHVAIVHTDEALGVYGAIDCGGYVTSFMLAAQALGIATIPQAALAFHSELVRKHFGLGDDRRVVCGISFGFPDRAHKANSYRTNRAGIADTVTFVDE